MISFAFALSLFPWLIFQQTFLIICVNVYYGICCPIIHKCTFGITFIGKITIPFFQKLSQKLQNEKFIKISQSKEVLKLHCKWFSEVLEIRIWLFCMAKALAVNCSNYQLFFLCCCYSEKELNCLASLLFFFYLFSCSIFSPFAVWRLHFWLVILATS